MPESTSTSNRLPFRFTSLLAILASFYSTSVLAAGSGGDRTLQPEEDDLNGTPFTKYGETDEQEEEDEDTQFMKYGRMFGISLGLGIEGATGNRGILWQGGFPLVDFKVHYWFDFHTAIDLDVYTAPHFYVTSDANGGQVNVNMIRMGIDLKYYFDTKDLSAPISFANPFLEIGGAAYTKTENSIALGTSTPETALGVAVGGGLEFAVSKKTFFQIEGQLHVVTFPDTYNGAFLSSNNIADLSGYFYTFTANVLFTW